MKIPLIILMLSFCHLTYSLAQSDNGLGGKEINYRAGIYSGYESNVLLSPNSKGDIFEEAFFSLGLNKRFQQGYKFSFDYNLDYLNYNEFTGSTNLINHCRLSLVKGLSTFNIGSGYDLAFFYYPNADDQDFLFQKGFLYLRQDISKKSYHKLQLEVGLKGYTDKKALAGAINTLQDEEQQDKRLGVEYSAGSIIGNRLFARLTAKFYKNDSNARFQKFYDFQAYEVSPFLRYRLFKDLDMSSGFTYLRKDYASRLASLGPAKEKDNIYSAYLGFSYKKDNNLLSLSYAYRNNSSNAPFAKYNDNVISCGWQHNF